MGIRDPVRVEYREKIGKWVLLQGRETFYDPDGYLITHESYGAAVEWSKKNLGIKPEKSDNQQARSNEERVSDG